jgi:Domain of unknown function (DUF4149)
MTGVSFVRLASAASVLALWIGAALLVAAVVAPTAFRVLPTRALAGQLVGGVLPVIFVAGALVGVVAAVLAWADGGEFARTRVVLPVAMSAACLVAQFVVYPKIDRLRAEMGPSIEALDPSDPRRAQFGKLHGISVAWMGAAMLAAGLSLVLTVLAARDRS